MFGLHGWYFGNTTFFFSSVFFLSVEADGEAVVPPGGRGPSDIGGGGNVVPPGGRGPSDTGGGGNVVSPGGGGFSIGALVATSDQAVVWSAWKIKVV